MERYTAIVLDDEERGRNALVRFLTDYCPEVDVIGVAGNGELAYEQIVKLRPQILFLDIEIAQPNSEFKTSFQLLEKLPDYSFEVVFVTAYEEYALKAIRAHAIGYVLKPISIEDLIQNVNGVVQRLNSSATKERLNDLVSKFQSTEKSPKRIWVNSLKEVVPVNYDDIIRLEAQGKYTDIHCVRGNKLTSSKNLGEFAEMLPSSTFIKVHRSHIVNANNILKYSKEDGGELHMNDGTQIPVSKSGKERLFDLL
jgi:two-component system LytT family response regulator